MNDSFWHKLDVLLMEHSIRIDRPKGKAHPRYPDMIYPLDYGELVGTNGGDGDGIDVWLGSLEGEKKLVGAMATVDSLNKELEIKLFVNCTQAEMALALQFLSENQMGVYFIAREN